MFFCSVKKKEDMALVSPQEAVGKGYDRSWGSPLAHVVDLAIATFFMHDRVAIPDERPTPFVPAQRVEGNIPEAPEVPAA